MPSKNEKVQRLRRGCFVWWVVAMVAAPALPDWSYAPDVPYSPYPAHQPYSLLLAQTPDALARQIDERIRALQREAERLATEARTLVSQVRRLEIERNIRVEEAQAAEAAVAGAKVELEQITTRVAAMEQQKTARLPDLKTQLVDLYKRGRSGNLRMLFAANSLREFSRASRAVAAIAAHEEQLIREHRRTLEAVRKERRALDLKIRDLRAQDAKARQARALAERALGARSALIEQIDSRRDLTAQYIGELQEAHQRIERQVASLAAGRTAETVAVPMAPFRGALEWPVTGAVTGRFGQPSGRTGGALVRNGIEVAAAEGTPVRAIHAGTIGFAEGFAGLGTVVIVDHGGNNSSVYGYLSSMNVQRGDMVAPGAEVGRVGSSPSGPPALYFELRIDGRFVDPLQWLKPR